MIKIKGSGKASNWNDEEDEVLCRAYMAMSEDREIGIGQTKCKLWDNVGKAYNLKRPKNVEQSLAKGLQSRYVVIVKGMIRICSIY